MPSSHLTASVPALSKRYLSLAEREELQSDLMECYAMLVDSSCKQNTIRELVSTFEALQRPLGYLINLNPREQSGKSARNLLARFEAVNEQIATATAFSADFPTLSEEDDDCPFRVASRWIAGYVG